MMKEGRSMAMCSKNETNLYSRPWHYPYRYTYVRVLFSFGFSNRILIVINIQHQYNQQYARQYGSY